MRYSPKTHIIMEENQCRLLLSDKFSVQLSSFGDFFSSLLNTHIPPLLVSALIASEDRRFYRHQGVDFKGILRALFRFLAKGKLEGASTIEQQLVRTITCRYEITLGRKIQEIVLATLLHKVADKHQIPKIYLAVAYFGWRMNGIEQAFRRKGINPKNFTLEQAASIIARLKYPEPQFLSIERAMAIDRRRNYIVELCCRDIWDSKKLLVRNQTDETISNFRSVQENH